MAAGNSPRQKMINLMYLVFIAMLALNVGVEVLRAFGIMNERFEEVNEKSKKVNDNAYQTLQIKASEEPGKFAKPFHKAEIIKKISDDLYDYIVNIKESITSEVQNKKSYELMNKSDILDQKFFITTGYSKEGQKFIDKIENYRKEVVNVLGEGNPLTERVKSRFDTSKVTDAEGREVPWLKYNFEGFPLIASISRFSQIQYDIVTTEEDVFSAMLEGQLKAEISMTNYTTLLEQPKGAYYQGEQFTGAIVLGRKDNTTKPSEVDLSLDGRKLNDSDYEVRDGKVQLKVSAGNSGDHKITGTLYFEQDGERVEVPVDQSFVTIPKPNSAVVSADKMNVVYRAIANPITISMPGVPDNKINASAPGLKKIRGTQYVLTPGQGKIIKVNVTGEIDGQKFSSSQEFRIKDIPTPMGALGGATGDIKRSKDYVAKAAVSAILEDFDFDLKLQVKSFMLSVPGQPSVEVRGSRMDSRAQSLISRAKRGDVIRIFDIKSDIVGNSSYHVKPTSAVNVQVTN